MEFTKKESYAKMIAIYLKERMDRQGYELSQEFVQKFPGEMMSHLLLAESAFRLERYSEAKVEGRKALRYATSESDTIFCTMIFASACFHLKDYIEAHRLLQEISTKKTILEVEEALFVFSVAMRDEQQAIGHMRNLLELNRDHALKLMETYLLNLPTENE